MALQVEVEVCIKKRSRNAGGRLQVFGGVAEGGKEVHVGGGAGGSYSLGGSGGSGICPLGFLFTVKKKNGKD